MFESEMFFLSTFHPLIHAKPRKMIEFLLWFGCGGDDGGCEGSGDVVGHDPVK